MFNEVRALYVFSERKKNKKNTHIHFLCRDVTDSCGSLMSPPAPLTQAGCMYIHGGVVNMSGNRRTGSLYKVWLVVPSLLELTWEKVLKTFPHIAQLSTLQLLNLGLTHTLIQRLK